MKKPGDTPSATLTYQFIILVIISIIKYTSLTSKGQSEGFIYQHGKNNIVTRWKFGWFLLNFKFLLIFNVFLVVLEMVNRKSFPVFEINCVMQGNLYDLSVYKIYIYRSTCIRVNCWRSFLCAIHHVIC